MSEQTDEEFKDEMREIAANVWNRARINAFAHKVAKERTLKKAKHYFVFEMELAFASIFCLVLMYFFLSSDGPVQSCFGSVNKSCIVFSLTLSSIILNLLSVAISMAANYLKYDVYSTEHTFLLGAYQYIAQKARATKRPDLDSVEITYMLRSLEETFAWLKSRGTEPSDTDFDLAHKLFEKTSKDKNSKEARSFSDDEIKRKKDVTDDAKIDGEDGTK